MFAIAMTLLVLDLHVPVSDTIHSEHQVWLALNKLGLSIVSYLLSFMTLGIFWVGQQTQLNSFRKSDRNLTWIHLAFLLAVTLSPFSTGLLAAFITYGPAVVLYWLNMLLLGPLLFASRRYTRRAAVLKKDVPRIRWLYRL